jgi:hypothetical protein
LKAFFSPEHDATEGTLGIIRIVGQH